MQKKKIILIGAGIMSATLGILIKKIFPNAHIDIYEKLSTTGQESSEGMNNAGTGHAAYCELNYTPMDENGNINISKALKISKAFELSKEFWTSLILDRKISTDTDFIHRVPHFSIVWGEEDVDFLSKRYESLKKHPLFSEMLYSHSKDEISQWIPILSDLSAQENSVACTKMEIGTDVDFGLLTDVLFQYLCTHSFINLSLEHEVPDLKKMENGLWKIEIHDLKNNRHFEDEYDFVFIGAGGGSISLLEKSNISEAEGYGGFPISGQWLVCKNEDLISKHHAKVYGKARLGAPPMSVPHLDTRIINGTKKLMFGPFAGFSTKFLKNGSYWDLPASIEFDNIIPMLSVGIHNLSLIKYLVGEISQNHEDRMNQLRVFLPQAKSDEWELYHAGQRVQIIKKDDEKGGVLEFGTELVCSSDNSLAALLGASPGASTSVVAMLDVIKKCFAEEFEKENVQAILEKIIPNLNENFNDKFIVEKSRNYTKILLEDDKI